MSTPEFEGRRPAPTTWDAYVESVVLWLQKNWGSPKPCPYCGDPAWTIGPVRRLPTGPHWPLPEGDEPGFVPAIPITSLKCGHVVLVNALWIFEPQETRVLMEELQGEEHS